MRSALLKFLVEILGFTDLQDATKMASPTGTKLYVGNLTLDTSEEQVIAMFSPYGQVESVRIIKDKNNSNANFAFVHLLGQVKEALDGLQSYQLNGNQVKVNWAFNSHQQPSSSSPNAVGGPYVNTSSAYRSQNYSGPLNHVFVGDLSPFVSDAILFQAFSQKYSSIVEARVMWDATSGKSRGYGFIAFADIDDATSAIEEMNGAVIGNRQVRLNWANQKNTLTGGHQHQSNDGTQASGSNPVNKILRYEDVVVQTGAYNTTVYTGNLSPSTTGTTSHNQLIHIP